MAGSGAIRAGKAFVEIFADNNPLVRGLKQAEAKVAAFGSKVAGLGAGVAGVGAAALGPLAAVGGFALKAAADFETAETSFAVMLGSAEKAKAVMSDLAAFGAATPFETTELSEAARVLLSFGTSADDLMPTLKALGDVAAGTNQPIEELAAIFGKAQANGRLMGDDLNQLSERGIPIIKELARQWGVSESEVRKLVEQGKAGFPNLVEAIGHMTGEGGMFAGMMDKQSLTLNGLFSTLKDTIGQVAREVGGVLLADAKALAATVIEIGGRIVAWVQANKGLIATGAKVAAVIAAGAAAFVAVGTALVGAGAALGAVSTLCGGLAAVVGFVLSPFGLLVGAVVAGAVAFWKFTEAGQALAGMLGEAFGAVKAALEKGDIKAAAAVLWAELKLLWTQGTASLLEAWVGFKGEAAKLFLDLDASIRKVWAELAGWMTATLAGAVSSVTPVIAKVLDKLGLHDHAMMFRVAGATAGMTAENAGTQAGRTAAKIDADSADAKAAIDEASAAEMNRLRAERDAAQANLDDALARANATPAEEAKADTAAAKGPIGALNAGAMPQLKRNASAAGSLNTGAALGSKEAFDAIAKAMNPEKDRAQLDELKKIAKNTANGATIEVRKT